LNKEQSHKPHDALRDLPSVDRVLRRLEHLKLPAAIVTAEVRAELDDRRRAILSANIVCELPVEECVERKLGDLLRPALRPVINATGVILHTNLGRAPLPQFIPTAGYSNLEYDLESGKRGKRDAHTTHLLEALLRRPAIVVNNNAAAVYLVLNELAAGKEAIVSRGELIEIGDGFRIPEIMARSGAILREVGTTNHTRIDDYSAAIGERTALIMRVHPSNFHMSGFTSRPKLQELAALAKERVVPVYEDLGSGCITGLGASGIDEPVVGESIEAGVDIVSFSGDKLLGGPQCGVIAGDPELVARIRRNPMYRALRVDKLIIEALETTLRHILLQNWEAVPVMRMIMAPLSSLRARAERISAQIADIANVIREGNSPIGGGSTPDRTLPSWVIELRVASASQFERKLRQVRPPVVGRIECDRVILDMRTVSDEEEPALVAGILEASR
jgi:L-seryl-tRNA(Ser) seleniumtransferase